MKKNNIKYFKGDLFEIALDKESKFLGLITKRKGRTKMLAGYFWNLNSEINDDLVLDKERSILFTKFSGLGFEIGNWRVLGRYKNWNKEEWPIPKFRRYDELKKSYYAIVYNEDLEEVSIQRITEKEASLLPKDGLHGYISLENHLAKITTSL